MSDTTVRVQLGPRSYDIRIFRDDLAKVAGHIDSIVAGDRLLAVTDANVRPIAEPLLDELEPKRNLRIEVIPPGEASKSLEMASRLYDALVDFGADRRTAVIAVGGGVVGDLAGFAAATYARGIPLYMVPTTLLAMVDSSVGGKTAVNHPRAKNIIGAFHQPVGVGIVLTALESLPDREYRSGLAEVVKYGVIMDADFFAWLETHVAQIRTRELAALETIVQRCCRLKAEVVEEDEQERSGKRAILNYGHTFAHAFETSGGYREWLHGEAVAAGMMCAAELARRLGLIDGSLVERQRHLLRQFGLPTSPQPWPTAPLLEAMKRDKKALGGRMRFVLPHRLGHVALHADIDPRLVEAVIRDLQHSGS